jgi:hypothetical protein
LQQGCLAQLQHSLAHLEPEALALPLGPLEACAVFLSPVEKPIMLSQCTSTELLLEVSGQVHTFAQKLKKKWKMKTPSLFVRTNT